MGTFLEAIKVVVDTDTSKAAAGFKNVKTEVQNAEGSFNKLKTGAGGIFDAIGSSAAVGMAGAGAAVGAFAVKAINQFQNLALEVDNFTQKTGTSADAASRWVEVSKDLGVSTDSVAAAFGRVAREDAAGKLTEFGLAAGTTSDRFAELLDKIGRIPNENERAAQAFKVFGRSWQDLAPLLDTTEKIKDRLAETPKGHLISDKDIANAREFRNNMDDLRDAIESVVNVIGRQLVQAINDVVAQAKDLGGPLVDIAKQAGDVNDSFSGWFDIGGAIGIVTDRAAHFYDAIYQVTGGTYDLGDAISAVSTGFGLWGDNADDAAKKVEVSSAAAFRSAEGFDAGSQALDDWATNADAADKAGELLNKMLADQKKKYDDLAKAQNDQVSAQRGVGDAQIEVGKATDDYTTFLGGLNEEVKKAGGNQQKLNDINREAVANAGGLADAVVNLHTQQAAANGTTIGSIEKFDLWGHSMIDAASKLKGPMQDAVLGYIGQVNDIPPEKLTEIQSAINQGDLDTAKKLLDEASAARTAAIIAQADTAKANQDLDAAAHERFAKITAIPSGQFKAFAGGGDARVGEVAWVGEQGKELVAFGSDAHVYSHAASMRLLQSFPWLSNAQGFAGGGDLNLPERDRMTINPWAPGFKGSTSINRLNIGTSYMDAEGNTYWVQDRSSMSPPGKAAVRNDMSARRAGDTIIINMPPGSDGNDVVEALRRWTRRNGRLPVELTTSART